MPRAGRRLRCRAEWSSSADCVYRRKSPAPVREPAARSEWWRPRRPRRREAPRSGGGRLPFGGAATAARPATVRCSKTSRGVNAIPRPWARATSWIDMISRRRAPKKESSAPTDLDPEDLREQPCEQLLGARCAGRVPHRRARCRIRQRGAVELAVRRQRERRRAPRSRPAPCRTAAAAPTAASTSSWSTTWPASGTTYPTSRRPPASPARHEHDGRRHAGHRQQRRLDLARLHAESAQLTWKSLRPRYSSAPAPFRRTRSPVRYIRCPAAERVGDEAGRGEPGAAAVAAGHLRTGDVQLAGDAGRDGMQAIVEHPRRARREARPPIDARRARPVGAHRRGVDPRQRHVHAWSR